MREPGTIERTFGGAAAPGLGSMFMATLAGAFIGSSIANAFEDGGSPEGDASGDNGGGAESGDASADTWGTDSGDVDSGDVGGDFGGGDFGGDFGF